MPTTKVSIIYYSQTGTVDAMAHRLTATAEKLGAEVRLRSVGRDGAEVTPSGDHPTRPTADDVTWADVVLFGTPARFGNVAGRLKIFIDSLGGPWREASSPTRSTPASPPARPCTAARSRRC